MKISGIVLAQAGLALAKAGSHFFLRATFRRMLATNFVTNIPTSPIISPIFYPILYENHSKTDVHFNHDHESPEIALLEKWNNLAQKFFRMHEADLRPKFYENWAGKGGRFQREIKKLERNFSRKCSNKDTHPRQSIHKDNYDDFDADDFESRKRRSAGQLRVAHNPGHRMRHIVRNVEKWTEEYLTGCSNQKPVIARWRKFVDRWEREIAKNPIFQEEFKKEEKYLR